MTLRLNQLSTAGAALALVVILVAAQRLGLLALALVLAVVAGGLLLTRPRLALAVAVGAVVVAEIDPAWGGTSLPSRLYTQVSGTKMTPAEALVLLALFAALLAVRPVRAIVTPRPFGMPLLLLGLGIVSGAITGHDAGVGFSTLINTSRSAYPLILMPWIVVNVVSRRAQLRRAIGVAGGLASFKGFAGLLALAAGLAPSLVGSTPITYYDSPANAVMMAFLLVVAAAALSRARLPRWVWLSVPFVFAALLLSYRRSFWVATVLGLLLVLLLASGQTGRRLGIPAVVLIALATYLSLGTGLSGQLASPSTGNTTVASRLQSLNPTALATTKDDRYRLDERRNVLADLEQQPIAGLGFGTYWPARYPLASDNPPPPRDYVHFGVLWWWMKLGILGLIGYVWLMIAAVVVGLRVWRRHHDPLIRATALGAAMTVLGLAVAELTASFIGSSLRMSIVFGALVGLLAAMHLDLSASGGALDPLAAPRRSP